LRPAFGSAQDRQQHGSQDGDYRNDNEKLNQGKAAHTVYQGHYL
jgi:hypothetical protein